MSHDPSAQAKGDWEVYLVEYARSHQQAAASLIFGIFRDPPVDLPFGFVLARANGRVVLCDCGFMNEGHGAEIAKKFGIPHWISPVTMLGDIGVSPADVTDVVVSHAHFDHMGTIDQFPKARIHLQRSELLSSIEAMALPPRYGVLAEILNPDDILAAVSATREHRLNLIEGDQDDVLPGLHVRFAPGHTLGQQFVLLDTPKGRFAVAGDCIYSQRNLTGDGGGHDHQRYVPLGTAHGSTWDQFRSFDKLERSVAGDRSRIIILHDHTRWAHLERVASRGDFGIYRVA